MSMGLGPLCAIYQAHVNRYLLHRELVDTSRQPRLGFLGDGELDEVESIGALGVAGREHLDNLIFVVNCNLQRLDGPVRGNGKIIQEAEATFRGAGWNVIKVIWGSKWDELLARDVDGVLLDKMNTTPDGEFQKYATESGAYIREHFFGPDPRLRRLVEHLSDDELAGPAPRRPRLPQALRRLQARHRAGGPAHRHPRQDGEGLDARPRDRGPQRHPPDQEDDQGPAAGAARPPLPPRGDPRRGPRRRTAPLLPPPRGLPRPRVPVGPAPGPGRPAARRASCGPSPPYAVPDATAFSDMFAGSGTQAASTTMAFARLLRNLRARPRPRRATWLPSSPTRPAPSASSRLIAESKIYAPEGQRYTPVDSDLILRYAEDRKGQVLQEGITEAGAMASFIALATVLRHLGPAHAARSTSSIRCSASSASATWPGCCGDIRGRGILAGCTAGRTTLQGEGLQHDDGHSPLLASVNPAAHIYDPAFAYEIGVIMQDAIAKIMGPEPEDRFWYLTLYNENYPMPPLPEGDAGDAVRAGILRGMYRFAEPAEVPGRERQRRERRRAHAAVLGADVAGGHGGPRHAGRRTGACRPTPGR